jgi:hypothetical protein
VGSLTNFTLFLFPLCFLILKFSEEIIDSFTLAETVLLSLISFVAFSRRINLLIAKTNIKFGAPMCMKLGIIHFSTGTVKNKKFDER